MHTDENSVLNTVVGLGKWTTTVGSVALFWNVYWMILESFKSLFDAIVGMVAQRS